MRSITATATCLFLFLFLISDLSAAGEKVALLIGNVSYQKVNQISGPTHNVPALDKAFTKAGFATFTIFDATHDDCLERLGEFSRKFSGAEVCVIYYGGHGIEVGGISFVVPVDGDPLAKKTADMLLIPLVKVIEFARRVSSRNLVLWDACRDNPGNNALSSLPPAPGNVLDGGTLITYACEPTRQTVDGGAGCSPFTTTFINEFWRGQSALILLTNVAAKKYRGQSACLAFNGTGEEIQHWGTYFLFRDNGFAR